MVRLILIAAAIFLAIYLLSRRFNAGQKGNDGEEEVVWPAFRWIFDCSDFSGRSPVPNIHPATVGYKFGWVFAKSCRLLSHYPRTFAVLVQQPDYRSKLSKKSHQTGRIPVQATHPSKTRPSRDKNAL